MSNYKDRKGRIIEIEKMTDNHLENAYYYFLGKRKEYINCTEGSVGAPSEQMIGARVVKNFNNKMPRELAILQISCLVSALKSEIERRGLWNYE